MLKLIYNNLIIPRIIKHKPDTNETDFALFIKYAEYAPSNKNKKCPKNIANEYGKITCDDTGENDKQATDASMLTAIPNSVGLLVQIRFTSVVFSKYEA